LQHLDKTGEAYREALAIIQAGHDQLRRTPEADMPGFRPCEEHQLREVKYQSLREREQNRRQALSDGRKVFDPEIGVERCDWKLGLSANDSPTTHPGCQTHAERTQSIKPTLFLTALSFASLAEVPAAEPVTLSEDHRGAVNRQRRIFFQYDPAAEIQKKGGFGSDLDSVMRYVFDFVDRPDSQLDAICIDVSNEGVAHYRSTILRPVGHPGLVKWREAGIDYFDELIEQGHRRGKEIWWGLRMNEVERGDLAGYEPGVYAEWKERNPVKAAHPEWLIRSWWRQGFWNYAHNEGYGSSNNHAPLPVTLRYDGAPSTLTLPVWEPVKVGTEVKLSLVLFNHVEGG
jgi:hypothetical protein